MTYGIAFEFLDIGQGDATLVHLPPWDQGELFLVDFGKKSSRNEPVSDAIVFLAKRISDVCHARGLSKPLIDYLCITHIDGDHWNQLSYLIGGTTPAGGSGLWETNKWPSGSTLRIGKLIVGGSWEAYEKKDRSIAGVITKALEDTTVVQFPAKYCDEINGPKFTSANTNIYVLSSNRSTTADPNPNSVVLMFEYKDPVLKIGRKVILTGDAESKVVEPAIIDKYKGTPDFLKSVALKLGHHGSKGATSADWIKAVLPQAVFASGDRYWGHPYCEAFLRADQNSKLATRDNHRYCCGDSSASLNGALDADPKDYTNYIDTKAIYSNLWYVVKDVGGYKGWAPPKVQGGPAVETTQPWGFYQGTQWRLQIDPGEEFFVSCVSVWPMIAPPQQQPDEALTGPDEITA